MDNNVNCPLTCVDVLLLFQTLEALNFCKADGAVETYIGVGAKKGHSKDAAASDYLIANGFMLPNPSVG